MAVSLLRASTLAAMGSACRDTAALLRCPGALLLVLAAHLPFQQRCKIVHSCTSSSSSSSRQ